MYRPGRKGADSDTNVTWTVVNAGKFVLAVHTVEPHQLVIIRLVATSQLPPLSGRDNEFGS